MCKILGVSQTCQNIPVQTITLHIIPSIGTVYIPIVVHRQTILCY